MAEATAACVVCGASRLRDVLRIERAPVFINQLCHTEEQARTAAVAAIELAYCHSCGHLFNQAFDASRLAYSPEYENSLHFSGKFQSYANALARDLTKAYELGEGKSIVEVGCGRGDFLASLCSISGARGFGFDPSCPSDQLRRSDGSGVTISQEFFSEQHASLAPDLLCCRHCLEHVSSPVEFLTAIRQALPPGTPVFFEVPNALFTLCEGGLWDIIYEHPHYFTPSSLRHVFERAGFRVDSVSDAFGGQFLTLRGVAEPQAKPRSATATQELSDHVSKFRQGYEGVLATWNARLAKADAQGQSVFAWGAGSKGSTFLNAFRDHPSLKAAIDINPRKQGHFIAGSGHPILSPAQAAEQRPSMVVVMNPLYLNEVEATLQGLSVKPELLGA